MIVYVLTHHEPSGGGSVEGVFSTEEKAREAAAESSLPVDGLWFWKIEPFNVDDPRGRLKAIFIR